MKWVLTDSVGGEGVGGWTVFCEPSKWGFGLHKMWGLA